MIDHIIISVSDVEVSTSFYRRALEPLGYTVAIEAEDGCGFAVGELPDFWIRKGERVTPPVHIAFATSDREMVEEFHQAAMAAGGTDNGPPGLRPQYHPNYYGAFVLDPDGNNIEAVCHRLD